MSPAVSQQHRGCIIPQAVCNTQSSAPEDGRDHRSKHVELIGIINKQLLLHLVGVYVIYPDDGRRSDRKMSVNNI
jgi:hypothetical protein